METTIEDDYERVLVFECDYDEDLCGGKIENDGNGLFRRIQSDSTKFPFSYQITDVTSISEIYIELVKKL